MKVKTWIEVEQEVEVEVSIADMMSSIAALATGDREGMYVDCINSVHRVLRSIPDEAIAAMNDKKREIIFSGLRTQAERFQPTPALGGTDALAKNV